MSERITRLKMRGDTAAAWTAANPVLLAREFGIETDTRRMKMGDGTTAWAALPYFLAAADVRGQASRTTDATVAGAAAGTYRAIGAAGTLDASVSSGLAIGTTDPFGLRNTGASAVLLDVLARVNLIGGNNHVLALRIALNGVSIPETEVRQSSGSGNAETNLASRWMVTVPAGGEVSMQVTNYSDTAAMTFKRGTLVAQEVHA